MTIVEGRMNNDNYSSEAIPPLDPNAPVYDPLEAHAIRRAVSEYTVQRRYDAVKALIAAERERCAKVAEAYTPLTGGSEDLYSVAQGIADNIRKQK